MYRTPPVSYRDHVIQWSKDLGRTIDYLQTRLDLEREKVAYYGLSWGALLGGLLPSLEGRIKVIALVGGGFSLQKTVVTENSARLCYRPLSPLDVTLLNASLRRRPHALAV